MSVLAAYGLLAQALVFAALIALLPLGILRPKAALLATATALLVGIAPSLHGIFGAPSLTLLQLAIWQLASKTPAPCRLRPAIAILAFAVIFYGMAWGFGPFDPYGTGYQARPILLALLPMAAAFWWKKMQRSLLILSIDLAAYASGFFPNLWDVLIDPLLVLLALAVVMRRALRALIERVIR